MHIALAQINYHIGNFASNTSRIINEIREAKKRQCDLVIFSELAVCGYPPLDLLEQSRFIARCSESMEEIAAHTRGITALIGIPTLNPNTQGKKLMNSACCLQDGQLIDAFHKTLLPTYDIFDENRYFEPNREFKLLQLKGKNIAVTICEDLWFDQPVESNFANHQLYNINPVDELMKLKPDLLVNLAASPFAYNRTEAKRQIFMSCARDHGIPVIYVNQVGAQTELIFEGGSLILDSKGKIIHELNRFEEDRAYCVIENDQVSCDAVRNIPDGRDPDQVIHDICQALVMGVRDYFRKSGLKKAVLGLSGGIDSAVTLAIAARALGKDNVHALLLPSQYTSEGSITDARQECRNIGCTCSILSIRQIFKEFKSVLAPLFQGLDEDITEENIQSRIRGTLLMAYSNKFGHILLNTSNKSEAAVGYGTLYGDLAGGLSVLGDVYKTYVYQLAHYLNRHQVIIPEQVITKPPSAELKPGQKDTDSLPEYDLLDRILYAYIEQQKDTETIIGEGIQPGLAGQVISLVNQNEYKRYQTPPILRISTKSFGAGRRMPLVAKY